MTGRLARVLAWLSVTAVGCAAPDGNDAFHGRVENGHPLADLIGLPLPEAALQDSVRTAVNAPGGVERMEALVECALPGDESITIDWAGGSVTLDGFWGLAAEWLDGPCDVACQEWVTACLLVLVNAYPVHVGLLAKGPHPVLEVDDPSELDAEYPIQEGAFFGNMFAEPSPRYACRGAGYDAWYRTLRTCTVDGSTCGIDVLGTCGLRDGLTGQPTERRVCESEDERGAFTRCHDRPSEPGGDNWPEDSRVYERVITTFLRDARFE